MLVSMRSGEGTEEHAAVGNGLATIADDGSILDTWFPAPVCGVSFGPTGTTVLSEPEAGARLGPSALGCLRRDPVRGVQVAAVRTCIENLEAPPRDAYDVYLRLHLLSHRLIPPRYANLEGLFALLVRVAWTSRGPCLPERVDALRWHMRAAGVELALRSVDKIPRMTDYVVPSGVRIADASRVRLGAHLGPGTTVLHEGFCNFDAGTLGSSMVEGRISAGVVVDEGTDIGGGASIMGTLSGGGRQRITIGKRCLLGANSGTGISLGDDCVIEAGCYVTAGTLVRQPSGSVVKALTLSGRPNILFRRHSQNGAVEAVTRRGPWGRLDPVLHAN